uniref:Uncharacterized protein n=1 Tax=Fundulus heteroclitus TaxID=8078 RepID=A0A3Q2PLI8_FUNHE
MALWGIISLSLHCWVCLRSFATATAAPASLPNDKPGGPLDWLLSDKGPFHHSPEYIDFVEKNRQGFSTRYKIYSLGKEEINQINIHECQGNSRASAVKMEKPVNITISFAIHNILYGK